MSKTSSASKRKYNKQAYNRYEFSVRIDSGLSHCLEQQKTSTESISELVKKLLCEYYQASDKDICVPEHMQR